MIRQHELQIDPRRASDVVADLAARLPGYLTGSTLSDEGPGAALAWIHARYTEIVLERLNQVPEKTKLVFLSQLGIEPIPARAARAPIVFQLGETAPAVVLPAGSRVAAPPPPGSAEQIVFESERSVGLTPARIVEVVSLWPGRDQYIDHGESFQSHLPIHPFDRRELEPTPHVLYIAHDTLLALAGRIKLEVEFDLSQVGSETLDTLWEYWDGKFWRGFKNQRPACSNHEAEKLDGTEGFTRSGKVRLETDCGESAKREIDGINAHWIRARLDERLPVDPKQILPEVAQLRLSTVVERPLTVQLVSKSPPDYREDEFESIELFLTDTNGSPIAGALVEVKGFYRGQTDERGQARIASGMVPPPRVKVELSFLDSRHVVWLDYRPTNTSFNRLIVRLEFQLGGLLPDVACGEAGEIDLSAPFYPLGEYPQPGSAFYFSSEEAFSKAGARLTFYLTNVKTPQDSFAVVPRTDGDVGRVKVEKADLDHRVNWEYWNGRTWKLLKTFSGADGDFTDSVQLHFVVPQDMAFTKVQDQEALWMRARLVSGGYGFLQTVIFERNKFRTVIPRPPAIADFRMSYAWQCGPHHAEHVLSYNDFAYADRTEIARWPGTSFQPFAQVEDMLPAIYIGHSKPLPVDLVNVYCNIAESPETAIGPALVWEYWNGFRWRQLTVEDETQHLTRSGMLAVIGPNDAKSRPRFGNDLYWVRARMKEDGPPPQPELIAVYLNAVWASQQQSIVNEPVGVGTGRPHQSFRIRNAPILEGERVEVCERSGERANVEWRILALALFAGDRQVLRELEEELGSEGTQTEIRREVLRLRRDRHKRVSEVWVQWHARPSFLDSQSDSRHYVLDRQRGLLQFGDGMLGMPPPLGAQIMAVAYCSGGGQASNVSAGAINQLLAGVGGVESLFNPKPAEGGADAETLAALSRRGPRSVRHRGRAVTAADYETMAIEASPAIAVAQALSGRDPAARRRPGWVTLVIIPRSDEPRPWPSPGLRDQVGRYIEARTSAAVAAAGQVFVTGPDYLPIDVSATIAPFDASSAGVAETNAHRAVASFLHPLTGGPQKTGWPAGRDVCLSDLASVLERVPEIDYVRELAFLLDGVPKGEIVAVPPGKVVVAGQIRIKVILE